MIDPLPPPGAAERLAALRAPSAKRKKPAHTSKVLTAGISTTALFGMVAVMGWQSTHGAASAAAAPEATVPVAPLVPVVTPSTTIFVPTPVPSTVAPLAPAVTVAPVTAAPVTAAPVVVPVVIPVAVPAPAPQPKAAKAVKSNTATKSSG